MNWFMDKETCQREWEHSQMEKLIELVAARMRCPPVAGVPEPAHQPPLLRPPAAIQGAGEPEDPVAVTSNPP